MPFTPFHLGFGVLLIALIPFLDPIALLLGTILIDLEGIFYLLFNVGQLHGIMHSFMGVIVLFGPISFISWGSFKIINKFYKIERKFNLWLSLLSSIIGLVSHILFDTGLYSEMMLFYPFTKQTGFLLGYWTSQTAMITLSIMFVVGAVIIAIRMSIKYYKKKEIETKFDKGETQQVDPNL